MLGSSLRKRVLLVEDDARLREALETYLQDEGFETSSSPSLFGAREKFGTLRPDLLIVDFMLADGTARELLRALAQEPQWPAVIAVSGRATAADAFELAGLGVRAFLQKPFTPEALSRVIRRVCAEPPNLEPSLRASVGLKSIQDVQNQVRRTMLLEALQRCDGNRTGAARLLRISRQVVQHMVRAWN